MWTILAIQEWRCQDINQILLREIVSVYSAAVKFLAKLLPFGVNCQLQFGLGKKERKLWSQPALACFMLKATSVPQTPQTSHSQYSSPVEALSLIVDSKYQPVDLDNLTIELHVPSKWKKSLQSHCSVDFDLLASMRFVMTFDITLHNHSSVGKLTNLCN